MAIQLSANYSKKLGLPQFSSHSFSASVEVELTDITQVDGELQRLYALLQHSVDQQIQNTGYVPGANHNGASNGNGNGRTYKPNGAHQQAPVAIDRWNCTDGQRGFILRIVSDNQMQKQGVEDLSQQLYGIGVKQLDKMQASQLIEELLAKAGKPSRQNRWRQQPNPTATP